MALQKYFELESIVPDVPERLLEVCSQESAFLREKIIQLQRFSLLVLLYKKKEYPKSLLPPRDKLLDLIHSPPEESLCNVTPQQVQFITILVDFVIKNPNVLLKAIQFQYKIKKNAKPISLPMSRSNSFSSNKNGLFNSNHNVSSNHANGNNQQGMTNSAKLTELNKDLFDILYFSTIPAFFGHFSTNEHLFYSFPFFCNLVGTLDEEIIDSVLTPYYCNGCTFRFIESIYDKVFKTFFHDLKLDSQQIQHDILKAYINPLVESVMFSYPLLPHTHQFLFKFMQKRGRDPKKILDFFVNKFLSNQLIRYVQSTPFTSHFNQFKELIILIQKNVLLFSPVLKVMNSPSFFEVPSAFSVFNDSYSQILLTPIDVHVMMAAIVQVDELPKSVLMFKNQLYLKKLNLTPFWVKIYSKKQSQIESSFNWRNLIFSFRKNEVYVKKGNISASSSAEGVGNDINESSDEPIENNEHISYQSSSDSTFDMMMNYPSEETATQVETDPQKQAFERIYRQLKSKCECEEMNCIDFLSGNCFLLQDKMQSDSIHKNLGDAKYNLFFNYVVQRELEDLSFRSRVFESYLVHSLALRNLKDWHSMVESSYIAMAMPVMKDNLYIKLNNKQTFNAISKQIQQFRHNQSNNDPKAISNSIENLISSSMGNNVQLPLIRQLLFMKTIKKFLNVIVPINELKKLKTFENLWMSHLMQIRESVNLPSAFKNTKDNQFLAMMLNRRLWNAIENLKSLKLAGFEWALSLILDTLNQIDDLTNDVTLLSKSGRSFSIQNDNAVMQYALAYCDTPLLITNFVIINIFVVKQKNITNILTNESKDLLLWSGLESSILKILSKDEKLMTDFLSFQEELHSYQI